MASHLRTMTRLPGLCMVCGVLALAAHGQGQDASATPPRLADPLLGAVYTAESTLADQRDVAVTVYNNGLGLVRDQRKLALLPGEQTLAFKEVAARIRPESVQLVSVSDPGRLHVLEQNYEFDLISPETLMRKAVGRTVRLLNHSTELGFTERSAELVSVENGPVYRIDGAIYLGHPGTVVLPEVPEGLRDRPTLVWTLDNAGTDHEVEATYLTEGLSWTADYVIDYRESDSQLDLTGWVTLENRSGATYADARLKLVAGEVQREQPEALAFQFGDINNPAGAMPPPPPRQEAFGEWHLYTLPRRTTVKDNQSKQVLLLSAEGVTAAKRYEAHSAEGFQPEPQRAMDVAPRHVDVFLEFANTEANKLGLPLPAGTMRVYQADASGAAQFAGEDAIKHTPKDEKVRLKTGQAFDIVFERRQTDYARIADTQHEAAFEIVVRNHKGAPVEVDVVEALTGDWTILNASHAHEKRDARTAVFPVNVPAGGEVTVTYRVRVRL